MRRVNANSTAVDEGGGREQGGARGRSLLGGHLPPARPGGEREGRALRSRLAPALASEAWGRAGSHAGRWRGAARGAGLAQGTGRPRGAASGRAFASGACGVGHPPGDCQRRSSAALTGGAFSFPSPSVMLTVQTRATPPKTLRAAPPGSRHCSRPRDAGETTPPQPRRVPRPLPWARFHPCPSLWSPPGPPSSLSPHPGLPLSTSPHASEMLLWCRCVLEHRGPPRSRPQPCALSASLQALSLDISPWT